MKMRLLTCHFRTRTHLMLLIWPCILAQSIRFSLSNGEYLSLTHCFSVTSEQLCQNQIKSNLFAINKVHNKQFIIIFSGWRSCENRLKSSANSYPIGFVIASVRDMGNIA